MLVESCTVFSRNCSPLNANKEEKKMRMTSVTLDPTKVGAGRMRPFMTSAQLTLYTENKSKNRQPYRQCVHWTLANASVKTGDKKRLRWRTALRERLSCGCHLRLAACEKSEKKKKLEAPLLRQPARTAPLTGYGLARRINDWKASPEGPPNKAIELRCGDEWIHELLGMIVIWFNYLMLQWMNRGLMCSGSLMNSSGYLSHLHLRFIIIQYLTSAGSQRHV
ncbi:hypothetical protein V8C35DRAFT_249150 [Trichoderma chlorosporum]